MYVESLIYGLIKKKLQAIDSDLFHDSNLKMIYNAYAHKLNCKHGLGINVASKIHIAIV